MCASALHPYWLDEVLQLVGTQRLSGGALLRFVQIFPGTVPLGYLIQHGAIALFGFSPFSTRLPSELSSVLSCVVLFILLRYLGVRSKWIPIVCWMVLPLQLRYALEGRPYAIALLCSMLATLCFFRLIAQPSMANGISYSAAVALGLYTAPYTLFIQFGYLAWVALVRKSWASAWRGAAAVGLAGCAFLPWYLDSVQHWKNMIATTAEVTFTIGPKFVLVPIREISGGGYTCSIALTMLCAVGYFSPGPLRSLRACLLLGTVSGFAIVVLVDMTFGYYFAIRQIIFILVPLILLAAQGISTLLEWERRWLAALLCPVLVIGSTVKDIHYLSDRSEDWNAATNALRSALTGGACALLVRPSDIAIYQVFDPDIARHACGSEVLPATVVIPSSRYSDAMEIRQLRERLVRKGYEPELATRQAGGTTVVTYRRR